MKKFLKKDIKNTKELFKILNITDKTLSSDQKKSLHEKGYLIIPPTDYMLKNLKKLNLVAKELIEKEGDKGGWEGKEKFYKKGKFFQEGTNRLGNLIDKHEIFRNLIQIPELLAASYEVIKSDIKIAGANLRNPLKDSGDQRIHIDWKPREKETDPYSGIVSFIFLDDSNLDNGPLRIIPGSHKKLGWPDEHINVFDSHKNEIKIVVPAGTIIVAYLNLWHAGSNNVSGKPRKMIMINVKSRDQLQLLNYKKYLSKNTKNCLSDIQSYLLAIRNCDETQKEDSVGVGQFYRLKYGNKKIR